MGDKRQARRRAVRKGGKEHANPLGPTIFQVHDGRLKPADLARKEPAFIQASLSRTELKLYEAQYFLRLLLENLHHEAAILYHLDAFVSAFRATTWVLQKECHAAPGFVDWYARKQSEMRADPNLALLAGLRTETQKEGIEPPMIRVKQRFRYYLDGRIEREAVFDEFLVLQAGEAASEIRPDQAVVFLEQLVDEAKQKGFLAVSAERRRPMNFAFQFLAQQEDGAWLRFEPPDPFRPPPRHPGRA